MSALGGPAGTYQYVLVVEASEVLESELFLLLNSSLYTSHPFEQRWQPISSATSEHMSTEPSMIFLQEQVVVLGTYDTGIISFITWTQKNTNGTTKQSVSYGPWHILPTCCHIVIFLRMSCHLRDSIRRILYVALVLLR